jgi:hypothetical protein
MEWAVGWARAALVVTLLAAPCAAAQDRLELAWEAPPACPTAEAIEGEVARLVGGTLPPGAAIRATGRASARDAGGFALYLTTEVDGARGERTLDADRCDELAAAAALILALMIDAEAAMRAEPIEPSTLALPEPEPPPRPLPSLALALSVPGLAPRVAGRVESQRAIDPDRTIEVRRGADVRTSRDNEGDTITGTFGIGALFDIGTLPNPAGGLLLEGGLGIPLIDARLRATLVFPGESASAEDMPEITAELWAFTAGVLACVHPIDVARFFEVCVDVEFGSVFGSASGPGVRSIFGAGGWFGVGGGPGLVWQPEPWFDLEALAELFGQYAQTFYVNIDGDPVDIYIPPPVAFRFGLAAHLRF